MHRDFTPRPDDPAAPAEIAPDPHGHTALAALLDEVLAWTRALEPIREGAAA